MKVSLPGLALQRLAPGFVLAQPLGALGLVGERRPSGFGTQATLAHMVERCRVRFGTRLGGARSKEVEVGAADDGRGQG